MSVPQKATVLPTAFGWVWIKIRVYDGYSQVFPALYYPVNQTFQTEEVWYPWVENVKEDDQVWVEDWEPLAPPMRLSKD